MDPAAIYTRARKLVAALEFQLQQLEEGVGGSGAEEEQYRHNASSTLNQLYQDMAQLDKAVEEYVGQKRDLWQKKAAQLSADAAALRKSIERYMRTTHANRRELRERSLLLGGASESVTVDAFLQQRASLASSHTMVDDFTAQAGAVLESLRSQRGVMKGVHRRVLDMASTLGVSTGLMRMIERRTTGDRIIVYGGMALLSALLFAAWWFTRK
jgi:Golgi SNAP receptor complex protein 2